MQVSNVQWGHHPSTTQSPHTHSLLNHFWHATKASSSSSIRNLDWGSLQVWYKPFNTSSLTPSTHNTKQWKTFNAQYDPWVIGVLLFMYVYLHILTLWSFHPDFPFFSDFCLWAHTYTKVAFYSEFWKQNIRNVCTSSWMRPFITDPLGTT